MSRLAPVPEPPLTEERILAKLNVWGEHLAEIDAGTANCAITRREVLAAIDALLDDLLVAFAAREQT